MDNLPTNKEKVISLYKEMLRCYSNLITNKCNASYDKLENVIAKTQELKEELIRVNDVDSLVILSMWFIDGVGWLNLLPEDEQVTVAVMACKRAIDTDEEIKDFMNLDIQYINPKMTIIDQDNIDEFCEGLQCAQDELEEEINKIKKEDTMKNNTETNNTNTDANATDAKTTTKAKVMDKVKKFGKYAAGAVVVVGAVAAAVWAYNKYDNDGIIVLDFSK